MPGIFISYRRDDSGGHAGALARELGQRFGAEHVFLDLDDIRGGQDFVAALEQALGQCDVLIDLIGRHWLAAADGQERRRLDVPGDFVRMEIAGALRRHVSLRNAMRLRNAS